MSTRISAQGVNLDVDRVTEIGALLWDWDQSLNPSPSTVTLIDEPNRPDITEELEELTGISDNMLLSSRPQGGRHSASALDRLLVDDSTRADYILAHNGRGYDYPMLKALYQRHGKTFPPR